MHTEQKVLFATKVDSVVAEVKDIHVSKTLWKVHPPDKTSFLQLCL